MNKFLKGFLISRGALMGATSEDMANAARMNVRTFERRLADPDEFKLGELKKLAKKYHFKLVIVAGDVKEEI